MARILFLYSEMMPYMEAVIAALVEDYGDEVCVVSWDEHKLTAHQPVFPASVIAHKRSALDTRALLRLLEHFQPQLVYVSGRMDKGYLRAVRGLRKNMPIVMGMDTQWAATLKQGIQIAFRKWLYQQYFSHIWTPGPRQFAFAQLLGYDASHIIPYLLSGNLNLFLPLERSGASRKVVFLGRLERIKGLDLLLDAWQSLASECKNGWELLLIGSGSMKELASGIPQVRTTGFLKQPEMLALLEDDCVFCLPSRKEPWGVVVHEMAAAGMPMILSREAGAGDLFLIHGYNGFLLKETSSASIKEALMNMMQLEPAERRAMGERSRELARRITPQLAAASLRSLLS